MKSKSKLSATKQNKVIFPSNSHKNINTVPLSRIVILFITVIQLPIGIQLTTLKQNPHTNFTFFGSSLDVPPLYNTPKNIFNNNKIYFESKNEIPRFLEISKTSIEPKTKYHKGETSFTNADKQPLSTTVLGDINEADTTLDQKRSNFLNSKILNSQERHLLETYDVSGIYNESKYTNLNITHDLSTINVTLPSSTEISSSDVSIMQSKTKHFYLYFQCNDYLESIRKHTINSLSNGRFTYNSLFETHNSTNSTEFIQDSKLRNSIMKRFTPFLASLASAQRKFSFTSTVDAPLSSSERASTKVDRENLPNHLKTITILGLFEITNTAGERSEGRSELAAARLAIRHINQKNILPGYQLQLAVNDTKCDPGVGIDAFFHALYVMNNTRMVMLLGTACSDVTESLAKVVPYWNIVQVSFGSTSPALSDRHEFPLFYRTVTPDSSHNPARLAFIRKFGWETVTVFSQNEDIYSLAVNNLVTELELANITCKATITFSESDFKDQLHILRNLDTRIIIGSFSRDIAQTIFCEVHQLGMYGSDYVWILQGGPSDIWWENVTECPQYNLIAAVDNIFLVSSHNSIVGDVISYSGLTNSRFSEELELLSLPVTQFAPQTYDAVWAIALALQGAEENWNKTSTHTSVHQFNYDRKDMAEEFLVQLSNLNFLGISGPVSFSGADRIGISAFYQVQAGEVAKISLFYPWLDSLDFSCPDCKSLIWQGGQIPIAKRIFKIRVVTIETAAFLSVTSLALIGIILAFGFLAFNLHFRKLKYIKLSSPHLNNLAVVGCIFVYTAVILLGLDHATLPTNTHFGVICTARVYLLSGGFSLAFGSMFTKTYRIHHIFTQSHGGVIKKKLLQDTQLIFLICILLLIDGLIVTLWVVIDPIQRQLQNLTLEISSSDRSVVYQPQVEVCRSQYTHRWLGVLYGYKGLLLLVGVYMAWETRHVKIPALNDSQYIGMSVYSVVITSVIVVVLANLISNRATLIFVTITTLILMSTTTTLCLLFVPKLSAVFGHVDDNRDPIMRSMGLKIEYNTRRFVTDDRRELYYRVQVQNRVYRREITALDSEIRQLKQKLLDIPSSSSTSSPDCASQEIEFSVHDSASYKKKNDVEMHSTESGLPLLLFSVIPSIIPRASWPSSEYGNISRHREVTFSSQPKLNYMRSKANSTGNEDFYITNDAGRKDKLGVLTKLKNFLGSRSSNNKISGFNTETFSSGSIGPALHRQVDQLAGLISSPKSINAKTSCNTEVTHSNQYGVCRLQANIDLPNRDLHQIKQYRVRNGADSIISNVQKNNSAENIYSYGREGRNNANKRKLSLAMCLSHKEGMDFIAIHRNLQKWPIRHQNSQPTLSFKEKLKGSPKLLREIIPACSSNTLEDNSAAIYTVNPCGYNISQISRRKGSQHHLHNSLQPYLNLQGKCRSLEDASSLNKGASLICKTTGIRDPI